MTGIAGSTRGFGWVAAWATTLAGSAALIGLRTLVPFPANSDHAYFLPASFAYAAGGHLANPWMQDGFNAALNWHGFLQPWLVGAMARALGGGWGHVYLALDALAAATLLASVAVAARLGLGGWRVCAMALITFALMLDARSRPETLATLEGIALVALLSSPGWRALASPARALATGGVFACLLATHPAIFALSGLSFGIFVALGMLECSISLRAVAAFGLLAGIAFAGVFLGLLSLCFGGSLGDWLAGIGRAAQMLRERADFDGFLTYFAVNRFMPGMGLGLLFPIAIAAGVRARKAPARLARAWFAWLAAGLFGVALWSVAIRIPATYYNFSGLLAAMALIACLASRPSPAGRWLADGALAALALSSLAGGALWVAQSMSERVDFDQTRALLARRVEADLSGGLRVCADAAALPALDDNTMARRVKASIPLAAAPSPPDPAACDVFYELQNRDELGAPRPLAGFALTEDDTQPRRLAWFHGRPLHLGFARYSAR